LSNKNYIRIPKFFTLHKGAIAPPKTSKGSGVYKCTLSKFARILASPDNYVPIKFARKLESLAAAT
jgi:hypothetical protein